MYAATLWCDNKSSRENTQKKGSHRLKNFDDNLDAIIRNLESRERTSSKSHMAETHGDYIKQCVLEGKFSVKWVPSKQNLADTFTKPLPCESFMSLRDKLINPK